MIDTRDGTWSAARSPRMPSPTIGLSLPMALFALLAASSTPARAADSQFVGGNGGAPFRDECPAGDVLHRVDTTGSKDLNTVRAVCRPLQGGVVGDQLHFLDTHGSYPEGGRGANPGCDGNTAIFALRASNSRGMTIHAFSVGCRNVGVTSGGGEFFPPGQTSATKGGEGFGSVDVSCPGGQVATGLTGRYGALIDALGLICSPYAAAAAQPQPAPAAGPSSAEIAQMCGIYANRMSSMINEAHKLDCAFSKGAWSEPYEYWKNECEADLGGHKGSKGVVKYNGSELAKLLGACKAASGAGGGTGGGGTGGGGQTMKVVAEVTMYNTYNQPNKDLCYLRAGDTLTKLPPDGNTGQWLHVSGNSGDCSGKTGYVYNNGELQ